MLFRRRFKRYKAIILNHSFKALVPWGVVDTTKAHEYAPQGAGCSTWSEEAKAFPNLPIGYVMGKWDAKRVARILNRWEAAGRPT